MTNTETDAFGRTVNTPVVGREYLSKSGDTLYGVIREHRGFIICSIRVREFNWKLSNVATRFTRAHVANQVESGNWTEV